MVIIMGIKGVIAWRFFAEKINLIAVKALLHALVGKLIEEKGMENVYGELKEIGKRMGMWIYLHYLEKARFVAKSIKDDWKEDNLGWKFFTGKEFQTIIYEIRDGGKTVVIKCRSTDNPICKGLESPDPRIKFSAIAAGIFEWASQQREADYGAINVIVDETKCLAAGDEYCEFTFIWEFPEDQAKEILKEFGGEGEFRVK